MCLLAGKRRIAGSTLTTVVEIYSVTATDPKRTFADLAQLTHEKSNIEEKMAKLEMILYRTIHQRLSHLQTE